MTYPAARADPVQPQRCEALPAGRILPVRGSRCRRGSRIPRGCAGSLPKLRQFPRDPGFGFAIHLSETGDGSSECPARLRKSILVFIALHAIKCRWTSSAMKHVLALIALSLAGASQAAAHPPDPCSSTSPTPTGDVQLRVSIPGGRTSFREGEIIPLALSFTSLGPERYRFLEQRSDRSGRFNGDASCLAP